MRNAAAFGVAACVLGAACGAANVRPYVTPFSGATVDTVLGAPEVIITDIARLLEADRIPVRLRSPEEGYVETAWFDARMAVPEAPTPFGPEARLRFWVDPVGNGLAQVIAEAAGRRSVDPSLPEREREVLLPPEHAVQVVLRRVMDTVAARFR